jgi:hypothetical protein
MPPACSAFARAFRSYSEGQDVLPLRPLATAAAGWGWRCCARDVVLVRLLRWLLFIRALLMLSTKK